MNVMVTGKDGFIGRHVVEELLNKGYELDDDNPEVLIHLYWMHLDDFRSLSHFYNIEKSHDLIEVMVSSGVKQVIVTGTCLEYGLQEGVLSEETPTDPVTPYGLAKDMLRRQLQMLQKHQPFILQWVRLFYIYESPHGILAKLDEAIDNHDEYFDMTGGEQLRDYMRVKDIARRIVSLIDHPEQEGVINCCSGVPVSIRTLVEQRIQERKSDIRLRLGILPYLEYEPMAFWGETKYESNL